MNRSDIDLLDTDAEDAAKEAVPLGRIGAPDEIAEATVFLASEMARYVQGA